GFRHIGVVPFWSSLEQAACQTCRRRGGRRRAARITRRQLRSGRVGALGVLVRPTRARGRDQGAGGLDHLRKPRASVVWLCALSVLLCASSVLMCAPSGRLIWTVRLIK